MEYLALFVVEHNVQRAPLHLVHVLLKSMVDLDQLVIVIMTVVNHQGLGIAPLQTLKSNPKLTQSSMGSQATQFPFILYLVASLRSLLPLFTLQ